MNENISNSPSVTELEKIAKDNHHILRLIQHRKQWEQEIHDCVLTHSDLEYARGQIIGINNELDAIAKRKS
jgi:hypothetical protein